LVPLHVGQVLGVETLVVAGLNERDGCVHRFPAGAATEIFAASVLAFAGHARETSEEE
jgi:hypothetical protein